MPTGAAGLEWTVPMINRLRELVQAGDSYSSIASSLSQEFGHDFTTNSCIGKARRMNFKSVNKQRSNKPRPARVKTLTSALPETKRPKCVREPNRPVSLIELEYGDCRWIVGEDRPPMYCGAKAEFHPYSYCNVHRVLAYQKNSTAAKYLSSKTY